MRTYDGVRGFSQRLLEELRPNSVRDLIDVEAFLHVVGTPAPEEAKIQNLLKRMVRENGWGATRIHGELHKLGFDVSERTVSRYLRSHRRCPENRQGWKRPELLPRTACAPGVTCFFTFLMNVLVHRPCVLSWFKISDQARLGPRRQDLASAHVRRKLRSFPGRRAPRACGGRDRARGATASSW